MQSIEIDIIGVDWYYLIRLPKYILALLAVYGVLVNLRKRNSESIINKGNRYHLTGYFYYWICSKILGFKKCSLILVPIYLQFKLTINSVFEEYRVGNDDDYRKIEDEEISVKVKFNNNKYTKEVNLILIDTYDITYTQIPKDKHNLTTINISRKDVDGIRSYSPNFIYKITEEVRKLPYCVKKINIYATTNPKHTELIARNVFQLGNRGNIESLIVFQQKSSGKRIFDKGYKIY